MDSAFQEMDQFHVKSERADHVDGKKKQDRRREGKGIFGMRGSGGLRETDRDVRNVETSGSDASSIKGKNSVDQMCNPNFLKKSDEQINESVFGGDTENKQVETFECEEKRQRKRKRSLMNDKQISMIERALLDEPDMQRHAASLQSWAHILSIHVRCTPL